MSCNGDCKSCKEKGTCNEEIKKKIYPNIKHIVGILSGKGGVGKSSITSMLAVKLAKRGFKVGILDADITGPSIPHAFGLYEPLEATDEGFMIPEKTKLGINVVSINLILEDPTKPVLWRGAILSSAIRQFYEVTAWPEIDFLLVDMPPGTSDIAITTYQTLPLDSMILVTTPQDLVKMVVSKAVNMLEQMKIKPLGIIENMSYINCPDCGKRINVFGESRLAEITKEYGLTPLAEMPINPEINKLMDLGLIEEYESDDLDYTVDLLETL